MLAIRSYRDGDAPLLIDVFRRSIAGIAPSKYTAEAVAAWIGGERDVYAWARRMHENITFVAVEDAPAGWIELEDSGHLEMLYCAPEVAGRGVAQRLYDAAMQRAAEKGIERFTADASRFAESFLQKNGWKVEYREDIVRDGVTIARARMRFQR